jgi:hypothetical protein
MDTQTNNLQGAKIAGSGVDNTYTTIGKQYVFFIFKLSPLFIKIFNDFYDVRKALTKFIFYIFLLLFVAGLAISLYVFKSTQSDMSFNMLGNYTISIIILVFYNFFNNIFYKELDRYDKAEKLIFLFFVDLCVWGLLSYLII